MAQVADQREAGESGEDCGSLVEVGVKELLDLAFLGKFEFVIDGSGEFVGQLAVVFRGLVPKAAKLLREESGQGIAFGPNQIVGSKGVCVSEFFDLAVEVGTLAEGVVQKTSVIEFLEFVKVTAGGQFTHASVQERLDSIQAGFDFFEQRVIFIGGQGGIVNCAEPIERGPRAGGEGFLEFALGIGKQSATGK